MSDRASRGAWCNARNWRVSDQLTDQTDSLEESIHVDRMTRLQNCRFRSEQLQLEAERKQTAGVDCSWLNVRACLLRSLQQLCALLLQGVAARGDVEVAAGQQRVDGSLQRCDLLLTPNQVAPIAVQQLKTNKQTKKQQSKFGSQSTGSE